MKEHWTQRSIKDYIFKIGADFIAQLEEKMETEGISQDALANTLNVTKSRVSQVLNRPGNITLQNVVQYTKAVGMKVSLVAYNDDDPNNTKGLINSEVFKICWEKSGKPHDFWAFQETTSRVAANMELGPVYQLTQELPSPVMGEMYLNQQSCFAPYVTQQVIVGLSPNVITSHTIFGSAVTFGEIHTEQECLPNRLANEERKYG